MNFVEYQNSIDIHTGDTLPIIVFATSDNTIGTKGSRYHLSTR